MFHPPQPTSCKLLLAIMQINSSSNSGGIAARSHFSLSVLTIVLPAAAFIEAQINCSAVLTPWWSSGQGKLDDVQTQISVPITLKMPGLLAPFALKISPSYHGVSSFSCSATAVMNVLPLAQALIKDQSV